MPQRLVITLADNFELCFNIRKTPLAELWLERMSQRQAWLMDNPDRFYGFGTAQQEQDRAVDMIQQCIATINQYQPIVDREFEYTQDCLNYLHNIFEQYHGLLDQQTSQYWLDAPVEVRTALANLNLAVHRCETALNSPCPRFVCTWFGMPKTKWLNSEIMREHGELEIKFGTVYLNYCEIGKTLEHLAHDNDAYIGDDAFRPFGYYSADFNVTMYDQDLRPKLAGMQDYINQHAEFFHDRGIETVHDTQALPFVFPVADLQYTGAQDMLISQIQSQQYVHNVMIEYD